MEGEKPRSIGRLPNLFELNLNQGQQLDLINIKLKPSRDVTAKET